MATRPEHQGRGFGRMVLEDLVARIRAAAPPDPFISLIADPPGRRLYESVGFVDAAPSIGMRLP
ncbi:GNAT family N-acetyltransferase [Brachybacterium endophyticum]|uniref:GNAT family N-acetyltransferase n=1 Tax=Brachybacterium endophyticum TaxID=2182385 RepID=UPI0026AD31C5